MSLINGINIMWERWVLVMNNYLKLFDKKKDLCNTHKEIQGSLPCKLLNCYKNVVNVVLFYFC